MDDTEGDGMRENGWMSGASIMAIRSGLPHSWDLRVASLGTGIDSAHDESPV